MRLRFTARAFRDLDDISAFISGAQPVRGGARERSDPRITEHACIFPYWGDHNL
jgi:hypothetical protein